MCTVLRHRHPARTRVDRTQLTRRELTCDGGRHSHRRRRVAGQAALCLRHHVLGPSVLRRPPRCFGRCDRLRQQALTCTVARPRRRGPVRPWLKRSVSSWRCGGCGSVVRSVGAFTHVHRKRASSSLVRNAWALAAGRCLHSQSLQLTVAAAASAPALQCSRDDVSTPR